MAHGFQQLSGGFKLEVGSLVVARRAKGKTYGRIEEQG